MILLSIMMNRMHVRIRGTFCDVVDNDDIMGVVVIPLWYRGKWFTVRPSSYAGFVTILVLDLVRQTVELLLIIHPLAGLTDRASPSTSSVCSKTGRNSVTVCLFWSLL